MNIALLMAAERSSDGSVDETYKRKRTDDGKSPRPAQKANMAKFGIEEHQARALGMFGFDARKRKRNRFVSLAKRVQTVAERDARNASNSVTNSLILETWEHSLLQGNPLVKTEGHGDRLIKRINEALRYLDENGFERSSQQRLFHRAFMQASYGQIYGADLHKNLVRLLEQDNISELRTEVAITTPRRFGKTFSIGLWCAVILVLFDGHDSSIYSTSARVSKMLLQTTLRFVYILQSKYGGTIVGVDKNEYVVSKLQFFLFSFFLINPF